MKFLTYIIMLILTGFSIYLTTLSFTGIEYYVIMSAILLIGVSSLFSCFIGFVRTMVTFNVVELLILLLLFAGNMYALIKFFA